MNLLLKILAAVAMLCVIAASSVWLIRTVNQPEMIADRTDKKDSDDNTPRSPPPQKQDDKEKEKKEPPRERIVDKGPIRVAPGNPLQEHFAASPINRPQFLKFVRHPGKTYHSKVVGTVTGRASKKNWGFQGAVNFTYLFVVETEGKVLENNGNGFTEERSFAKVWEQVIPGDALVGLSLPTELTLAIDVIGAIYGVPEAGAYVHAANDKPIPIRKGWIDAARNLGLFKLAPSLDPAALLDQIKLFAQSDKNKLLEGKVVQIVFVDGEGVTQINPIRGGGLDPEEKDMVIRANGMLDYYIFPNRKVLVGSQWTVPGGAFGSLLDPRLQGKPEGNVTVVRREDVRDKNEQVVNCLEFTSGQIVLKDLRDGHLITGQLSNLRGEAQLSEEAGVVTSAIMKGQAKYEKVSQEHLLFEARMAASPIFEVRYECTVK